MKFTERSLYLAAFIVLVVAFMLQSALTQTVYTPATPRSTPGYVTGRAYPMGGAGTVATGTAATVSDTVIYLYPFSPMDEPLVGTALKARTISGAANCSLKMAVFGHSLVTKRPTGVPVAGSNSGQACTVNSTTQSVSISYTFKPGTVYWAGMAISTGASGFVSLDTTPTPVLGNLSLMGLMGSASDASTFLGVVSAPYAVATDLMVLDLTSASFTDVTAEGVPVLYIVP